MCGVVSVWESLLCQVCKQAWLCEQVCGDNMNIRAGVYVRASVNMWEYANRREYERY